MRAYRFQSLRFDASNIFNSYCFFGIWNFFVPSANRYDRSRLQCATQYYNGTMRPHVLTRNTFICLMGSAPELQPAKNVQNVMQPRHTWPRCRRLLERECANKIHISAIIFVSSIQHLNIHAENLHVACKYYILCFVAYVFLCVRERSFKSSIYMLKVTNRTYFVSTLRNIRKQSIIRNFVQSGYQIFLPNQIFEKNKKKRFLYHANDPKCSERLISVHIDFCSNFHLRES